MRWSNIYSVFMLMFSGLNMAHHTGNINKTLLHVPEISRILDSYFLCCKHFLCYDGCIFTELGLFILKTMYPTNSKTRQSAHKKLFFP